MTLSKIKKNHLKNNADYWVRRLTHCVEYTNMVHALGITFTKENPDVNAKDLETSYRFMMDAVTALKKAISKINDFTEAN